MVESETTESDGAPPARVTDWTNVRGFQVLAAAGSDPEAPAADAAARAELIKELGARAARFSQSVDDSIVLASDGLIRWLGDPVARLIAGEDLLKPKAVLLADEALSVEDRDTVETRLTLWISAHIKKVLGPLEALAEPGAVAEPLRALAVRIAQALGVLERERVRQQVKTLDQSARSALRKLGVRFGSMYIFVPALLKPGARTLCSQLWGLRRGEAGAERLLAFAAAGRTSFAAEGTLAPDTYRVAGFRLCGDRVVRIDIVERLNDLIRAAIPDHLRPGAGPASEASGFLVSPQMTSLTGCAGESFASILRSLGYESHRVKRSEFEAAAKRPTAPTKPVEAPAAAVAELEAAVADAAESVPEPRDATPPATELAAADAAPAAEAEPVETGGAASNDSVDSEEAHADADSALDFTESAAPAEPEAIEAAETASSEPAEATPDLAPSDVAEPAPPAEPESLEAAETPAYETQDAPVSADSMSDDAVETPSAEPTAENGAPVVEVAESADGGAPAAEDDWVEVWRPAPRRRAQPPARSAQSARAEGDAAHAPRQARDPRRRWARDSAPRPETIAQDAAPAETPVAAAPETPAPEPMQGPREGRRPDGGGGQRQERGRRQFQKGQRGEEARAHDAPRGGKETSNAPAKKEYRPPQVDMDSPFAKLLALKPLLERRDKRT